MASVVEQQPLLPYVNMGDLTAGHRDVMNLMEFPFFSLEKKPSYEERLYDDGKVRIEISPSRRGLATIWDKDVLIYVASLVVQRMNAGEQLARTIRFHAFDFFRSCGRSPGGRSYRDLEDALARLQGTQIRTNIKLKDGWNHKGFDSWIKTGRLVERQTSTGRTVTGLVEVELNDWVWRQIVEDRTILSIDRDYFDLSSAFARRLYEVGRKHCGAQAGWSIALTRLAEKLGYGAEDTKARSRLKQAVCDIIEANDLPEYQLHLAAMGDKDCRPLATDEVRSSRSAFKTSKLVYLRRYARDRRVVLPRPAADPPKAPVVPLEEDINWDAAAAVSGLVAQMTERLKAREP